MTKYKPITTLPVPAQIFDILAHKKIMRFLNRFLLLNINQFGFSEAQNTEILGKAYDAISQNCFS